MHQVSTYFPSRTARGLLRRCARGAVAVSAVAALDCGAGSALPPRGTVLAQWDLAHAEQGPEAGRPRVESGPTGRGEQRLEINGARLLVRFETADVTFQPAHPTRRRSPVHAVVTLEDGAGFHRVQASFLGLRLDTTGGHPDSASLGLQLVLERAERAGCGQRYVSETYSTKLWGDTTADPLQPVAGGT